ncbi:MAG: hypothetical protein NC253_14285 [Ruminococcus sp.]|nr:hypothetical protein [Ruminococcus sp.]MCM1381676.1 hypothetical protein [Muribaculaceae bacterium]MCM1480461.1 hypothetical protein [Muribaculaceae bacterium]
MIMQESLAYREIVEIMDTKKLSIADCCILIGRLEYLRDYLKSNSPQVSSHNPHITMTKGNSK